MTQLGEAIHLGVDDGAQRLWTGALEARQAAADDVVALCQSLELGLHAAEILVIQRLQPFKDRFPATIGILLHEPEPEVDLHRDGIHVSKVLEITDVVDLLSAADLDCVSPGLHRGWEDRRFSCRRSRAVAQEAVCIELSADDQDRLLLLAAYRNRLLRCPPPVRIVPDEILSAFECLERIVGGLLKTTS